jgi:hypothetical protein
MPGQVLEYQQKFTHGQTFGHGNNIVQAPILPALPTPPTKCRLSGIPALCTPPTKCRFVGDPGPSRHKNRDAKNGAPTRSNGLAVQGQRLGHPAMGKTGFAAVRIDVSPRESLCVASSRNIELYLKDMAALTFLSADHSFGPDIYPFAESVG